MLTRGAPARSFLVIESDWPEYEPAWAMIEARMTGQLPAPARQLECWSCQKAFTLKDRQANDGCCAKCGAETELDDYLAAILAENEQLRGLQPEWPPRPPEGAGLPRYGLRWNGPQQPLSTPMDDGYWTPWHLADTLKARCEVLEAALKFYADREHYHFESGNWDAVSGEPMNILWCGDEPDFIEDGSVARASLTAPATKDGAPSAYFVESHMDDPKPMKD
jgi:hypothetical protein